MNDNSFHQNVDCGLVEEFEPSSQIACRLVLAYEQAYNNDFISKQLPLSFGYLPRKYIFINEFYKLGLLIRFITEVNK